MYFQKPAIILAAALAISTSARAAEPITQTAKITLDPSGVLVVDGKKVFPIALTVVPGPEAKAPNGKLAYEQFADDGVMFMRTGGPHWNAETIAHEKQMQEVAGAHGLRCCPWLGWDLANFAATDKKNQAELIKIIDTFKDSPGMGLWKGADEPEWGNEANHNKSTPEEVDNVASIIHANDPNHPILLIQAPRGTVASLKRYNNGWDIGGIDIYPISYPPGVHTLEPNKEISMVGDYTRKMREVAGGKPYWMTLQIAFSGVVKPGKTLRFPTFPEQRFMTYEAIINGSRGLTYFGGGLPQTLNARDKTLGFNWTYWQKVMLPILDEIGPKSPILPALIAPDSNIKLTLKAENPPKRAMATKAEEEHQNASAPKEFVQDELSTDVSAIEYLVRETPDAVYVLACKKEGPTIRVRFSGLPASCKAGDVVFEEPRKVEAADGSFTDWFGPHEVHVYKFPRQ